MMVHVCRCPSHVSAVRPVFLYCISAILYTSTIIGCSHQFCDLTDHRISVTYCC